MVLFSIESPHSSLLLVRVSDPTLCGLVTEACGRFLGLGQLIPEDEKSEDPITNNLDLMKAYTGLRFRV